MADIFSPAKRKQIMQAVRREHTAPETLIAQGLRALGFRFRTQASALPGKPDFYFPKARLVVFVHGCFWHGHGACRKGRSRPKTRPEYWREKIARNQRRDRRVARKLRGLGLSVYTVWECEIQRRGVPGRLAAVLRARLEEA